MFTYLEPDCCGYFDVSQYGKWHFPSKQYDNYLQPSQMKGKVNLNEAVFTFNWGLNGNNC